MNIDDYLNNLQSNLENHLSQFAVNNQQQESDTGEQTDGVCPKCGTKVDADANFCPNCGYGINAEEDGRSESFVDNSSQKEGIVWTDTKILAKKYGIAQDAVVDVIEGFIETNKEMGLCWYLLDMAERQNELGEATWMDYSDVLQKYIKDEGIDAGPRLSLFIIGGNDVIPQPAEDNPCSSGTDYDDRVFADFYYCFYGQLPLDFLDYRLARCNVARLPLEMGKMHTSIEEDLQAYFNISNMVSENGGIKIGRAVMTSNYDWIPASREMSRNLPTEHMDNEDYVVLDNMFLSPSIMEDMDEEIGSLYYEKLSESDMLMFNLHGACAPEDSGFYSNGLAFSIDMLKESNARIFNTVACWGGRYIKYKREQSMLLSAMYGGGVLLYCGSCVPAMGKCGNFQYDQTWRIQPAAYSETFMGRFAEYQCLGTMRAGESFLKAKCDYYNTSRMVEEDEISLATVLMFNLYGNPKLKTRPDINAIQAIQEDDGSKPIRMPFRPTKRRTIIENAGNNKNDSTSILSEVRGLVDNNLRQIHDVIVKNLYQQLGVEPRELYSVQRYETIDANGQKEQGYLYNYHHEIGCVRSRIRAKVDDRGRLIDAIQTK
jgi:hypothetical protein